MLLQPEIDEKEGWARGLANAIAKASSSTF
jgi:hypothetical protein